MKKLIKVYLQYPWKFPDSPYYKYLIDNPPNNAEFLNVKNQKGAITNTKKFWFSNFLKKNIRIYLSKFGQGIVNAHLTKTDENYDLIHCAHCLSLNKDKPWIADFECGWQFFVGQENKRMKENAKELILSDNCKKLVAWTETTKKEMIDMIPEIKNKIEVIYPAVPAQKIKKKKHKGINLVFVGRYFYQKGGYHALEAMKRLTSKYDDVRGIIISAVPKEIIEKNKDNKKITFYQLMPQKEVFEKTYSIGDISIYPAYADSFGFGILEAMSFGIPVITVDGYSRKETVAEGKTGFVVNFPEGVKSVYDINQRAFNEKEEKILDKIIEKAEILIKNKKLREKISKNCINEIKRGRFSLKERNSRMEKIYEAAIK